MKHGKINITEKEIRDKGRGDALSKGLILIQTAWFVLQCVARRVERLPVTELELVTLAFGALNFVTYAVWWNKPLNVECPVRVYKKEQGEKGKGEGKGDGDGEGGEGEGDGGEGDINAGTSLIRDTDGGQGETLRSIIAIDMRVGRTKAKTLLKRVVDGATTRHAPGESIRKVPGAIWSTLQGYVEEYRWHIIWHLLAAVLFPASVLLFMLGYVYIISVRLGGGDDDNVIQVEAKQVPTFHAGERTMDDVALAGLTAMVVATIFGAIHCVAWSFEFPSHAEKLLWIISSLVITSAPAACFILVLWMVSLGDVWFTKVLGVIFLILSACYISGRVMLLVLPFISLRSLPAEAYQTVQWTTFIPHV